MYLPFARSIIRVPRHTRLCARNRFVAHALDEYSLYSNVAHVSVILRVCASVCLCLCECVHHNYKWFIFKNLVRRFVYNFFLLYVVCVYFSSIYWQNNNTTNNKLKIESKWWLISIWREFVTIFLYGNWFFTSSKYIF